MHPIDLSSAVLILPLLAVLCSQLHGAQGQGFFQLERAGSWKKMERLALSIEKSPAPSSGTQRVDPLNGLKKYRGGYDIQNKHYWASAVFTGIYGYAIAITVLLLGLALLLLLIVHLVKRRNWSWEKITHSFSRPYYIFFTVALVVATIFALAFCCAILAGNHKLNREAKNVENLIIGAANDAAATILNVTSVLSEISNMLRPFDGNSTSNLTTSGALFTSKTKLYLEAVRIQEKVNQNKKLIDKTLKEIYFTIIVTSCFTMLIILSGLGIMNFTKPETMQRRSQLWRWFFSLNTVTFWMLTIFSWIAFGLTYAAHNVVEDTCTALKEYQQNPSSNSLVSLLPCVDLKTGNDSVLKIREGMYRVIIQANRNISKLRMTMDASRDNRVIPHICNPFTGPPLYKLTGKCLQGTVSIGSVPQALQPFRCSQNDDDDSGCVSAEGGHIPNAIYKTILAYSTAAQTLIDATPALERLTNCSFVIHAFSIIVEEKCPPMKASVHLIWAAFAGLATSAFLLLIFYVRELQRQASVSHAIDMNS